MTAGKVAAVFTNLEINIVSMSLLGIAEKPSYFINVQHFEI